MDLKIIIATHGYLAKGVVSAIDMITGRTEKIEHFDLSEYKTPWNIEKEVERITEASDECMYLILTDIKHGSVYNQLMRFCKKDNVIMISGFNLALVLELVMINDDILTKEKILSVIEAAKNNISLLDSEELKKMSNSNDFWE